jgi:Transposase
MRFYTTQHPLYCGIDLHARTMSVCILDQSGEVLVHRHRKTAPDIFLKAIAPYRQGIVVAVACLFTWYGLADLCADAGLPCVLGHALSLKAIPGGKATNDTIDSHKMAALLRGGMLPQASVSPAQMRATRDLLRRRMPLAHQRAELLAHVHNTNSQSTLPALGKKIADTATMLAHTLARAVSSRLTRQVAFDTETFFQREGRGADEPEASLDNQGVHLHEALERAACTASVHAKVPRGHETLRPAPVIGHPLSLPFVAALVAHGLRGLLLTRAWVSLDNVDALSPIFAEDGRRERRHFSVAERSPTRLCTRRLGVESTSRRVWCSHRRSAPSYGNHVRTHNRLLTAPGPGKRQKSKKPLTGVVCLLTTGVLIRVGRRTYGDSWPYTSAVSYSSVTTPFSWYWLNSASSSASITG